MTQPGSARTPSSTDDKARTWRALCDLTGRQGWSLPIALQDRFLALCSELPAYRAPGPPDASRRYPLDQGRWLRGWDSNPRPPGYEPSGLPAALPRVNWCPALGWTSGQGVARGRSYCVEGSSLTAFPSQPNAVLPVDASEDVSMMRGRVGHEHHRTSPLYFLPAMWYNAGTGRVVRSMLESDMSMTKARFLEAAKQLDVEVDDEDWSSSRHLHAYAPEGQHFIATQTRNIGLGDYERGERPNWAALCKEISLEACGDCDHSQ